MNYVSLLKDVALKDSDADIHPSFQEMAMDDRYSPAELMGLFAYLDEFQVARQFNSNVVLNKKQHDWVENVLLKKSWKDPGQTFNIKDVFDEIRQRYPVTDNPHKDIREGGGAGQEQDG